MKLRVLKTAACLRLIQQFYFKKEAGCADTVTSEKKGELKLQCWEQKQMKVAPIKNNSCLEWSQKSVFKFWQFLEA